MTMTVTMSTTVMGEAGSLLNSDTTYTVSKAFGASLVGSKRATDTNRVLSPPQTESKPYFQTDANGNVTGLVGPDNANVSKGWALRSAMEIALRSNAIIDPPWAPAPTWAAATVYLYGQCVRGAAVGSTGNIYMLAGSNASTGGSAVGTSAGSGGPTGIAAGLITDNTCRWIYVGAARASGTKPLFSTVTPTTSSDVMDGYVAFVSASNYAAMGLTAISANTAASPIYALNNCNLTTAVAAYAKNSGTVASPTRSTSSIKYAARLVTNAKKWIAFGGNPLYQYSNIIKQIKINGKFISESVSIGYTGALINPGAFMLDLSSFPPGNKTIELFGINNFTDLVTGIAVGADEFVYPLPQTTSLKIAVEGDSIGDMTYLSDTDWYARMEVALNEYLGCQNVLNNCIGGTGLISNNAGAKTTYIQRLADITLFAPDVLIINGAHNDDSYTSAARQTAMATYLAAVRAALPRCSIGIVGGSLLQSESTSGTQLTVEQDWLAAFTAFNASDKNSFFIPVLTASPKLLSSANGHLFQNQASPYNDGHPISWYYYHMNRVIADGVREFFADR